MNLQKKRYLFVIMVFFFLGFTIKDEETKATVVPTNFLVETPQLATAMPIVRKLLLSVPYTLVKPL